MANNDSKGCGCSSEILFLIVLALFFAWKKCSSSHEEEKLAKEPVAEYADSSLTTGSKPYASYFGKEHHGPNKITFKTSGEDDYLITIKDVETDQVINHVYIQGGDAAALTIPNGTYNFGFYTGKGWSSTKTIGKVKGGFMMHSYMQKDDSVSIHNQDAVYTLYPVTNGNLRLQSADADEIF